MILCLPERVSEGDAKFQGFCRRWNKWEGHPLGTDRKEMPSRDAIDGAKTKGSASAIFTPTVEGVAVIARVSRASRLSGRCHSSVGISEVAKPKSD